MMLGSGFEVERTLPLAAKSGEMRALWIRIAQLTEISQPVSR
jgi:hypothetical protein